MKSKIRIRGNRSARGALQRRIVSTLKLFTLEPAARVKPQPPRILRGMTWLFWALLSAVFAAATALLAKVGVAGIDSNLATAIRTTVILVFTWAIAIGSREASRPGGDRPAKLAVPRPLRHLHRPLLALLLPRPADGARLQRRASRQAQRRACHPRRVALSRRTSDPAARSSADR